MSKKQNFSLSKLLCHKRKFWFVEIAIIGIVICLCVWDYVDPPLWWQFEAQRNREAVIRHVAEKYPEARLVSEYYGSTKINPWNKESDYFTYELNGVTFSIAASNGKVIANGISGSRAYNFINTIISEGFLIPKGVSECTTCHAIFEHNLGDSIELCSGDDLSVHTGTISIRLVVETSENGISPSDYYWLYELYQYWKEQSGIADYHFVIAYYPDMELYDEKYLIAFSPDTNFSNSTQFFDAFVTG